MNRKQLLAALTAAGYTGKADLAEIKQYLANEGRDSDSITMLVMAQRWPVSTWNSLLARAERT